MRPIRAIVYGLGTMGRMATRLLREREVEVAAAYVRTIAGKDFSAQELEGVAICTPEVPFEKHGADVALLTHCTTTAELFEPAMRAARAGLDVVTIAEDAFEPFFLDEALPQARALDAAFRGQGKTLASVGVQDTFWFAQPLAFSASVNRIDRIVGRNICDLGAFGAVAALHHPINLTGFDFASRVDGKNQNRRGIFATGLRPLIRALGLNIRSMTTCIEPVFAENIMQFDKFDFTIEAGRTRGLTERTVFELERGVRVEGEFTMTFLPEGEKAYNEWIVEGSPSMNMRTDNFEGDVITAASLVNRLRDIMDAAPGFLSVDQLAAPRYRPVLRHPQ